MEILTEDILVNSTWNPCRGHNMKKCVIVILPEGPIAYYGRMRIALDLSLPPVGEWGAFATKIENDVVEVSKEPWFHDLYNMMISL